MSFDSHHFGVSESFAIRLVQRLDRVGALAPACQGRQRGSVESLLIDEVERQPDITVPELGCKSARSLWWEGCPGNAVVLSVQPQLHI